MQLNFTPLKKNRKIIFHIAAWAVFFLMPIIFSHEGEDGTPTWLERMDFFYLNGITKIFWIALFYLNTIILIPKLLYRKKWFPFVLSQLLLFALIMAIHRLFFGILVTDLRFDAYWSLFYNSIPFLFIVLGSIVYRTVQDRLATEKAENEQQKENLKTELSFLRSQISPHFLFNVLNNIVALIRLKSEELEPTILKLSSLMQYMLYEADEEKVLLKSEVDYLENYIDLQKLRFGDRLNLNIDLEPMEDWHTIEPMLLIPFVENAFKHGAGMLEKPVIDISLKAANSELLFVVKNKYVDMDGAKDEVSGIGLANVQRRLELLYGKEHSLNIDKDGEWFTVALKLKLAT